ncbi:MAG: hypothetical protein NWQ43_14100 [Dolichospermum sp.]|nr:hypothetical protein [Dolichospermum sp.]
MSRVAGIHVICKDRLSVERLDHGYFRSGHWWVAKKHITKEKLDKGIYFALHESKKELSYLEGIIEEWEQSSEDPKRIIVKFQPMSNPMKWNGKSAGEKGYLWLDD